MVSYISAQKRKKIISALVFIFLTFSFFTYAVTAQAISEVGTQPPEFSLKDIEGNDTRLSHYTEKKSVILLFWSTWSIKSREALSRFQEYYRKYQDRGIQVIGINADNETISDKDVEKIKKVVEELNITFPTLLDRGLNAFYSYDIIALPSTIVISGGKITYALPALPLVGTEDMFDYLLVLAGEPARKKLEPRYMPKYAAVANTSLARGFVKRKKLVAASLYFKKAIEKDPKYILPYIELARLYEAEGNNKDAEEILRKALSVEQDNIMVLSEYGYVLTETGNVKEAISILEKAVALDSYTPAYYYLAYALGKDGQKEKAKEYFDSALSLNPYDHTIYMLRGEFHENNDMLVEASSDYKKALELILRLLE